ncbi:MAG: M48 family metallopeptidase [Clostridiales bacterium]|nr:M48 family metallopeptidase [Clostridiales bacterium]
MEKGRREERRSVIYAGETIPFLLIKSKRKTWAISVEENGEVLLKVPLFATEKEISRILSDKKDWIITHYRKRQEILKNSPQSTLTEKQREALKKRYIHAAKEYFPKRVAYFWQYTGGHYERITIREQKTRWGSCSSQGTLSFNWKLMLAPPAVLDYVVVHELCHLKHMNHSRDFWQAVEEVLPEYREQRRWLKEHGSELNFLG